MHDAVHRKRSGIVTVVDDVGARKRRAVLVLEMVVGKVAAGVRKGSYGFQSRIDTLYRIAFPARGRGKWRWTPDRAAPADAMQDQA